MRIGILAKKVGGNIQTIRYYQRRGLMRKPDNSKSYGYYTKRDFAQLTTIQSDTDNADLQEVRFAIEGMTCMTCEMHVEKVLSAVPGVLEAKASSEAKSTIVRINQSETSVKELVDAINSQTGYKATIPKN